MDIYLATGNEHKISEFLGMKKHYNTDFIKVFSGKDFGGMPNVEEDGLSYEENAQLKVDGLIGKIGSKKWIVAEDTGLEVDALDGAPGLYTGRFGGEELSASQRNRYLLLKLNGKEHRSARFICCYCLHSPKGEVQFFRGVCEGIIRNEEIGTQGFGYEPVFQPNGYDHTFAQMDRQFKYSFSHRAMAFQALLHFLKNNV